MQTMLLHYLADLEFETLGIILLLFETLNAIRNMCATIDIKDIIKKIIKRLKKGFYFIYNVYLIYI